MPLRLQKAHAHKYGTLGIAKERLSTGGAFVLASARCRLLCKGKHVLHPSLGGGGQNLAHQGEIAVR